ncbi:MAG: hypothetical protein QF886_18625, partial [Planctomycetota bacterium]|nr:hypothetical protein [Planctomycetota bacterium]
MDDKPFIVFLVERFIGCAPGHYLVDFGAGEQAKYRDVLASTSGNLPTPAMHGCPDQVPEFAGADAARRFLNF